jgi:hypothetical protein
MTNTTLSRFTITLKILTGPIVSDSNGGGSMMFSSTDPRPVLRLLTHGIGREQVHVRVTTPDGSSIEWLGVADSTSWESFVDSLVPRFNV